MKTIFLYTTEGFSIRYLLKTDIFKVLSQSGHKIIILSDAEKQDTIRTQFGSATVVVKKVDSERFRRYLASSRIQRILISFRAFVLNSRYDTETIDRFRTIFLEQAGWGRDATVPKRIMGILWRFFSWLFCYSRFLRNNLVRFEQLVFSPRFNKELYRSNPPDLVVVTSLCGFQFDEFIAREALANRVPVCTIILSWDNTTGLGYRGYLPSKVIAWNETMKHELSTLNDIPVNSISVGGVAHFDHYFLDTPIENKKSLFKRLRLDPKKATLFFATKSPKRFPWGPALASKMLDAIDDGLINREAQLLIRLHPLHFRRDHLGRLLFQDILDEYKQLEEERGNLSINWPNLATTGIAFDLADNETNLVKALLMHSDIMLNMFSTMIIEAAIFDLPAINICIQDEFRDPSGNSRKDLMIDYEQTHNQRLIATGASVTAWSFKELFLLINRYLDDPSTGRENRQQIVDNEIGPHQGCAGESIGRYLIDLVSPRP